MTGVSSKGNLYFAVGVMGIGAAVQLPIPVHGVKCSTSNMDPIEGTRYKKPAIPPRWKGYSGGGSSWWGGGGGVSSSVGGFRATANSRFGGGSAHTGGNFGASGFNAMRGGFGGGIHGHGGVYAGRGTGVHESIDTGWEPGEAEVNLCEVEFNKLSEAEKKQFQVIRYPGQCGPIDVV